MALYVEAPDTFPPKPAHKYEDGWREQEDDWIRAMSAACREWSPHLKMAGRLLRFSIADGYALYMVLTRDPLQLIGLRLGDGYEIPAAHMRGLNLADILNLSEEVK